MTNKSLAEEYPDNLIRGLIQDTVEDGIVLAAAFQLLDTANDIINNKLDEKQNDSERDKKRAALENNKDACDLYGIDEKTVPIWVVKAAKIVQDFWYIIWIIIGFATTAPVVFLSKKLAVVFKRTWVAVLLAIIIYLAIVLVPLIINMIK